MSIAFFYLSISVASALSPFIYGTVIYLFREHLLYFWDFILLCSIIDLLFWSISKKVIGYTYNAVSGSIASGRIADVSPYMDRDRYSSIHKSQNYHYNTIYIHYKDLLELTIKTYLFVVTGQSWVHDTCHPGFGFLPFLTMTFDVSFMKLFFLSFDV